MVEDIKPDAVDICARRTWKNKKATQRKQTTKRKIQHLPHKRVVCVSCFLTSFFFFILLLRWLASWLWWCPSHKHTYTCPFIHSLLNRQHIHIHPFFSSCRLFSFRSPSNLGWLVISRAVLFPTFFRSSHHHRSYLKGPPPSTAYPALTHI